MSRIETLFNEFVATDGTELPLPGKGATWRRFSTLAHWAAIDLSVARLCEGHADALAILSEAGMKPVDGASYGVWASQACMAGMSATRVMGGWRLRGTKAFCSGKGIVERALLVASSKDGYLMFDVAASDCVATVEPASMLSAGMAPLRGETLEFAGLRVANERLVGAPDFYMNRPGFWFGAAGVAACWYGERSAS